ncbi:CotH kinase family protein [Clostridium carnis]
MSYIYKSKWKIIGLIGIIIVNLITIIYVFGLRNKEDSNFVYKDNYEDISFETHLPIIVIDTNGQELNRENLVKADLKVYDSYKNYNELKDKPTLEVKSMIKIRGNTTAKVPKKQYSINLISEDGANVNKEILGMPKESSWVLNGPYMDKSLIRNYIVYNVSKEIMPYAPRTEYCEVFLKTSNSEESLKKEDYIGLYLMIEKIKRDKNRVNISETVSYLDETSYIILRDSVKDDDLVLDTFSQRLKVDYNGRYTNELICVYPSNEKLTKEKLDYITKDVDTIEKRMYSAFYTDPELGYRNYIDVESFATYAVINEFFRNVDQGSRSAFYYKEIGGKLKAGPVWDYNFSMGNATYSEASSVEGFELKSMPWFDQLVRDDYFVENFVSKYRELRETYLNDDYLFELIDKIVNKLGESIDRNFKRWPEVYEKNVWPNPDNPATKNYEEEIIAMKKFISERGKWMDENIYKVKP